MRVSSLWLMLIGAVLCFSGGAFEFAEGVYPLAIVGFSISTFDLGFILGNIIGEKK